MSTPSRRQVVPAPRALVRRSSRSTVSETREDVAARSAQNSPPAATDGSLCGAECSNAADQEYTESEAEPNIIYHVDRMEQYPVRPPGSCTFCNEHPSHWPRLRKADEINDTDIHANAWAAHAAAHHAELESP